MMPYSLMASEPEIAWWLTFLSITVTAASFNNAANSSPMMASIFFIFV